MEKALEILKNIYYDDRGIMCVEKTTALDLYNAISELEEAMKPKTCEWKLSNYDYNLWVGKCGAEWTLIDGAPTENKMNFCPQCGGKLIEIEPKEK